MTIRKGMLVTILPLKCSGIVRSADRWGMKVAVTYWSRSAGSERIDVFMPHELKPVGGSHYFGDQLGPPKEEGLALSIKRQST